MITTKKNLEKETSGLKHGKMTAQAVSNLNLKNY